MSERDPHAPDGVSRRTVLRMLGAAAAARGVLACDGSDDAAPRSLGFFTEAERAAVGAFANAILPPEPGKPGGAELGAVAFIERLLTAFDVTPPAIYADGPYSGRFPLPDGRGGASGASPPNDLARYRAIDRVTERWWRIALYGSKAAGAVNDGIVPEVVGLRDVFKNGIAKAIAAAKAPLASMPYDALRDELDALDPELRDALIELVPQAAFGVPEYGGNPGGAGWSMVHVDGDVMPIGHALFDERTNAYYERSDAPLVRANPGVDPDPMDQGTRDILAAVVAFTDGKVF